MANGTVLKIPGAPGGVELTDEELDKMPIEQLQALQKQYAVPDVGTDVRKQIIPGLKEGAAGIMGAPAEAANVAGSVIGHFGDVPQSVEKSIRGWAAPYTAQEWQKWGPLKLSPEEQQPPKTFPGQVARSFSSYLPATVPLGATGGLSGIVQALARSGAAATTSEGLGRLAEAAGSPEVAPYAKALGATVGFGPVRGFTASAAREPAATTLERAGYPVSAAERSGSRLAATFEQRAPDREGAIKKLRQAELDPQENNWAVRKDLGQVWVDATNAGAPANQVNAVNRAIQSFQGAAGPKAKSVSADDYFKLSKQWGANPNPYVQQLGDVIDRHMAQQNPVWEGMRDKLGHVPDLKSLSKAHERLPFPNPRDPGEALATAGGIIPLAHAAAGGTVGPALETAALVGMLRAPHIAASVLKGVSPIARSGLGQAYMKGWPTDPRLTYAALLAGPAQRYLPNYSEPQEQVK